MNQLKRKTFQAAATAPNEIVWLKIGEVAKRTGIGVETLRFYERSGLLSQPARTEGGYRLYDSEALDTLEFIKRAQTLGFTLDEIKRIIAESRAGQSPCDEVREIVRQRLAELDERLEQMQRYRDALTHTLNQWDQRGKADGHFCGLIEEAELNTVKPVSAKLRRKSK
jgi:DNA-binding transcriptional MerR regulator